MTDWQWQVIVKNLQWWWLWKIYNGDYGWCGGFKLQAFCEGGGGGGAWGDCAYCLCCCCDDDDDDKDDVLIARETGSDMVYDRDNPVKLSDQFNRGLSHCSESSFSMV